jgi:hypothetical protein
LRASNEVGGGMVECDSQGSILTILKYIYIV